MPSPILINQLNTELKKLGWTEDHPRIKSYISKSSQKCQRTILSTDELSDKYLSHLIKLVQTFSECQRLLQLLKRTWKDPSVVTIFTKYGTSAQMPLTGWEELKNRLDFEWWELSGGF